MKREYDDIINLTHHVSRTRPRMTIMNRAAQFSPFAALTGYETAIEETARLTEERIELEDYAQKIINDRLQVLSNRLKECPQIVVTYFKPDAKKDGGTYITISGTPNKIDRYERVVIMAGGVEIPMDDITGIEGQIFEVMNDD